MEDIGDAVELPCDFGTALELWTAWRDKGIMARAGGLLDQPRWWRNLMRFISARHAPVYAAYMREQEEKRGKPQQDEQQDGDMRVADGFAALNHMA